MKKMSTGRAIGAAAVAVVAARALKGAISRYRAQRAQRVTETPRDVLERPARSPIADDSIETEASMESFPASDPPSWSPGTPTSH